VIVDSDSPPGHGSDAFSDFGFLMREAAGPVSYDFIRFDPSLESVFFQASVVLEDVAGRPLTEAERWQAPMQPRAVLEAVAGRRTEDAIAALDTTQVRRLIDRTRLGDLVAFLNKAQAGASA
jgi:hypothetical protein